MTRKLRKAKATSGPYSKWRIDFSTPAKMLIATMPKTNKATIIVMTNESYLNSSVLSMLSLFPSFNLAPQKLQYVRFCATATPQAEQYIRSPPQGHYDGCMAQVQRLSLQWQKVRCALVK